MKKIGGVLSILLGVAFFIAEQQLLRKMFRSILKENYRVPFFENFIGWGMFFLLCIIPILFIWTGIWLLRNKNFKIPGIFLGVAVLIIIIVIFIFAYTLGNA